MLEYVIIYTDHQQLEDFSLTEITALEPAKINSQNWGIGEVLPEASVRGAWNPEGLFLFFEVTEEESLRRFTQTNDPVWQDSCVEFFIQPDTAKPAYCNFEFNSLGALLSATGDNRDERTPITNEEAALIKREATFNILSESPYKAKWNLNIFIPSSVLQNRGIILEKNKEYRANFYKCADAMKDIHYLSWNPVKCEKPDFHRIDYFGIIKLKK